MSTQTQAEDIEDKDRDELVDFSIRLGQFCWGVYCRSKIGIPRLCKLPSFAAYRRANELFQCGFSARMLFCPPIGIVVLDDLTEKPMAENAWKNYLDMHQGKIVLDGAAYPDTPKETLNDAYEFFFEGFCAGTLAVREILSP